jgi:hypothetical protein
MTVTGSRIDRSQSAFGYWLSPEVTALWDVKIADIPEFWKPPTDPLRGFGDRFSLTDFPPEQGVAIGDLEAHWVHIRRYSNDKSADITLGEMAYLFTDDINPISCSKLRLQPDELMQEINAFRVYFPDGDAFLWAMFETWGFEGSPRPLNPSFKIEERTDDDRLAVAEKFSKIARVYPPTEYRLLSESGVPDEQIERYAALKLGWDTVDGYIKNGINDAAFIDKLYDSGIDPELARSMTA